MKRIILVFAVLFSVSLFYATSVLSHMGESGENRGHMRGMTSGAGEKPGCEMCGSDYESLHSTMSELNERVNDIVGAMVFSNIDRIKSSAEAMGKMAQKLEGTIPHYRLSRLREYKALVRDFGSRVEKLAQTVKSREVMEVSRAFGDVISTCVECHITFRDVSGPASSNTQHHSESVFTLTDNGLFSVEVLPPVEAGKGKGYYVDVIIHDSEDQDLENGRVSAYPWSLSESKRTGDGYKVEELRGGRYRIHVPAPQNGYFVFFLRVVKEGELRFDTVSDEVVLLVK